MWLAGDVFNILGAVLQGVLPTMVILAIYYTIADMVLLAQCFYYRGFTWRDDVVPPSPRKPKSQAQHVPVADERTALLPDGAPGRERRGSDWSLHRDLSHLSPAVPLVADVPPPPRPPPTVLQTVAFNTVAVLMVCAAGVAGWYLSRGYTQDAPDAGRGPPDGDEEGVLAFDLWGQIFGYLCAVLYLGSRLPQLLLNWRRKSTEGVSMLFFLFACLGNLTYVMSIFAYEPRCVEAGRAAGVDGCRAGEAEHEYGQYILINLSWLAGSLGTLLLDMGIFVQFFMYSRDEDEDEEQGNITDEEDDEAVAIESDRWDPRPLLDRSVSNYSR